jgi:hypothetical protein
MARTRRNKNNKRRSIPSFSNYKHIPMGCAELETEGNAVVVHGPHPKGVWLPWHSTVRRKQKGGRILGSGAYGFVIDPAIPCDGVDVSGKVSKVFTSYYASNEDSIAFFKKKQRKIKDVIEILSTIDPTNEMFIYPSYCKRFGELTESHLEDGVTEDNKIFSYLLPRGPNHSISDITRILRLVLFTLDDKTLVEQVYETMKPLAIKVAYILNVLHKTGIRHGDLYSGANVLIDISEELQKNITELNSFLNKFINGSKRINIEELKKKLTTINLNDARPYIIDWDTAVVDKSAANGMPTVAVAAAAAVAVGGAGAEPGTGVFDTAKRELKSMLKVIFMIDGLAERFLEENKNT